MVKIVFLAAFFVLVCGSFAAAIEIDYINIKDVFREGDTIRFEYGLSSDKDINIQYVPRIYCGDAPLALLELKQVLITKEYKGTYVYGNVSGDFEYKNCSAIVEIIAPEHRMAGKRFRVEVSPKAEFKLKLCESKHCQTTSKLFHTGDTMFLGFESNLEGLNIKASITMPNGSVQKVSVPAMIPLKRVGTYSLNASATKPGFKRFELKDRFAVIDTFPVILQAAECNGDGVCDAVENEQNCPQDCKKKSASWVIIFPLLALVMLFSVSIWLYRKK